MKTLLLLPLLLLLVFPTPQGADGGSSVVVVTSKWSKSRQIIGKLDSAGNPVPASAMIPANKNFERNRRINDPAGVRDPNADTIDGRAAALEKSVQDARAPQPKAVDGFTYRVKVRNVGTKAVELIFWEYQFMDPANPETLARRQFLCVANIKPDKERELQAFSLSGPSDVVNVGSLANKSGAPLQEKVLINRVEYADGTIWQRKDWNFAELKMSLERATATPWGAEMCRGL